MQSLQNFLGETNTAKEIYTENLDEKLNICIGNVSCDMDSTIGSIILAYYLTHKSKYFDDYGNYEKLWIPVINCPRSEIVARIDICFHLKTFDVDPNKLIFVDDIDFNYYAQNNNLNVAIIDHNKLDITQKNWDHCVVMVIDHHVDQGAYKDINDRIIEFCGSACSMAMNLIFDNNLEGILTKEICMFFSGAILLDTENFKSNLKGTKWGKIDEECMMKINRISFNLYYSTLISKKTDRELNLQLGIDSILSKDYKNYVWGNTIAGISVIYNTLYEMLGHFGVDMIKSKIIEKMNKYGLGFYSIMTQIYIKSGEPLRELMFYSENNGELEMICSRFEKVFPYPLQKKKFTGLTKVFAFYIIKEESVSRKKVEPFLRDIFEKK
jgi:inorganic pyrophosphatase/exopolyphosphatase